MGALAPGPRRRPEHRLPGRWSMRNPSAVGLLLLSLASVAPAQEAQEAGGLRRQAGYTGLWPFWSREALEDGSVRNSSFFGTVRFESEADGDWHNHIFPFYCTSRWEKGTDNSLALYPLLYARRRSPESDYDIALPLFYRWRSDKARHAVLWPLLQVASDPDPGPFRWIPVLFRRGVETEPARSRTRLGVPILLELFEHAEAPGTEAAAFGTVLNFGSETRGWLSLSRLERSTEQGRSAHLFPLFWARSAEQKALLLTPLWAVWRSSEGEGERGWAIPPLFSGMSWSEAGHDIHALFPLLRFHDDAGASETRIAPFYFAGRDKRTDSWHRFYSIFYGRVEKHGGEVRDTYVPFLLSRHHAAPEEWAVDVLFPLGHYSRDEKNPDFHAVRALPFYDRRRTADGDSLGVGGLLYRRHESFTDKSLSQWAPWPLVRWRSSPSESSAFAIPFFYYKHHESPGKRSDILWVLPVYFSGREEFEPRWRTEGDERKVLVRGSWRHFWPAFGHSGRVQTTIGPDSSEKRTEQLSEQSTYSTLYPFFQLERSSATPNGSPSTSIDAPWPLFQHHWTPESFHTRLFPIAFVGSRPERTYAYLYPLLSVEEGQEADDGFWHFTSLLQWYGGPAERRFRLFPLLFEWRDRGEELRSITGPLYIFHWRSQPDRSWFHLAPLAFARSSENGSAWGLFPLALVRDHGTEKLNYWSPARFFFVYNHFTGNPSSGRERHWSLLWKLAEGTSGGNGDRELRVLHRLFLHRDVKGQHELVINPLFDRFEDEATGRRSWGLLKLLFRWQSDGAEEKATVLFIPVWRRAVGAEAKGINQHGSWQGATRL